LENRKFVLLTCWHR